ncbi:MAG: ketoacyl-ACP synthase III [Burkholderiaceae bacterium]|nr:MAG: ketoacyl-ACP synthase III [Burkholderiaceae bacterium]
MNDAVPAVTAVSDSQILKNRYAKIIGTGSGIPARAVSNQMLADELATRNIETSDEWIVARTGIRSRYIAGADETAGTLGLQAARRALEMAGRDAQEIDLILVATSTPDHVFPATACLIQGWLGNRKAMAFDLQAACSGFVYALSVANSMIISGQVRRALVIGADLISRIVDWNDRSTCVLFGDGAGAVVLEASSTPGVLSCAMHADGTLTEMLNTAGRMCNGAIVNHPYLRMDGQAVFKTAVTVLEQCAREALAMADLPVTAIDWLIPHQANLRILQATAKRLGVPEEKMIVSVDQFGNTSAASVPLALDRAVRAGQIKPGHKIMLQGVGGGMTWGAALVQF